jgi:SAM-dependent methyltransferase
MFQNGDFPNIQHDSDLHVRESYDPWVHRVILQSLMDDQIVLEVGSGNMALDDPCIIRMDVSLTPFVDLVADVHALPFLPESLDYIFSLAVIEHLQQPFLASEEMFNALKNGGYIYHECNFVFAYHGYPHHYFNASMQGMEKIFSNFMPLRKGIAPYQMPSFAIDMVIRSYLKHTRAKEFEHGKIITDLLEKIIHKDLKQFDIYFSEDEALNIAAGTYYAGFKQKNTRETLIPPIIHSIWEEHKEIRETFPNINDLTTTKNILIWAQNEGKDKYPELSEYFQKIIPFNKREEIGKSDRPNINTLPIIEPIFGAIGYKIDDFRTIHYSTEITQSDSLTSYPTPSRISQGLKIYKDEGFWVFFLRVKEFVTRKFR